MSQAKKPSADSETAAKDGTPTSAVQLKTKPLLDRKLAQLAADQMAGLLTPEEFVERSIEACDEWAGPYLSTERREQLREWLADLAYLDPMMRRQAGLDE